MIWNWYDSDTLGMKVLQVDHGLPRWLVYSSPYQGRGTYQVLEGTSQHPPKLIAAILKVEGVIQVLADSMGGRDYLLVTVHEHKRWDQVQLDVQQVLLQVLPRGEGP